MQFQLFPRYDNIILWIESLAISKVKHPLKGSVDKVPYHIKVSNLEWHSDYVITHFEAME